MKAFRNIIAAAALAVPLAAGLGACHSIEEWDNDYYGNFDALWTTVDEHYCFFEQKGVDWQAVGELYRAQIKPDMKAGEFFDLCSDMLAELRDGHVNLISWFDISYYRKWWSDYPQNFDWRVIQEYYLDFDYASGGGFSYKLLGDGKAGYCRYSSFAAPVSDAFVDNMLLTMRDANGLILDLRDNGGGDLTNVERIVSHFITERTLGGYICHKTGPGHDDFSEPYAIYYDPAEGVRWLKPVIVLTNRSTFSAANNCVQALRQLPHVLLVGDTTGGGSGTPFSSDIPCGWAVRFSACPLYDADMKLTEGGIEPDVPIDNDPALVAQGIDTILSASIAALMKLDDETPDAAARALVTKFYIEQ